MSENRVVANFVDYCNLLEQARLDGYIQVVFPAIIALPDVCGSALYEIKDVGKRYKKWVKEYVTPVTRGSEGRLCVKCGKYQQGGCKQMCADTLKEYGRLVSESPKLLYSLRRSVVHNGYLGGQKYFLDISRADIKYPVQTQPFVNGKPAYGNMLIDVGVIAARLIHSAIEFYNRADTDVRERLDKCFSRVFDQNTFLSVSHIND